MSSVTSMAVTCCIVGAISGVVGGVGRWRMGVANNWSCHDRSGVLSGSRNGVSSVPGFMDNGVESVLVISSVLHCSDGAVSLDHSVVTFNSVSVVPLCLFFDVVSVGIVYSVTEFIVCRRLNTSSHCLLKVTSMFNTLIQHTNDSSFIVHELNA